MIRASKKSRPRADDCPGAAAGDRAPAADTALLTRACFGILLLTGLAATASGPMLDPIAADYRLPLGAAGVLLLLSAAGFFTFTVTAGLLSARFGRRLFLRLAFLLLAAGGLLAAAGNRPASVFVAFYLLGLALGGLESITVALVNDLNRARAGRALNFSQFFWGAGALLGPLAAGWLGGYGWRWVYLAGVPAGLLPALLLRGRGQAPRRRAAGGPAAARGVPWRQPAFLLLLVSMVFYVGTEMSIAGWLALYLGRSLGAPLLLAGLSLSLFWGAITAGRAVSGLLVERLGHEKMIIAGSVGGFACLLLAVSRGAIGPALFFFTATGFCYSSLWPTILACAGRHYPRETGAVFGVLIAAGAAGSMIFPPLVGLLAERTSLAFALGATAPLLLVIALAAGRLLRLPAGSGTAGKAVSSKAARYQTRSSWKPR